MSTPSNETPLLYPRQLKYLSDYLSGLTRGRLWLQVLIGMALGIAIGVLLGPAVGWVKHATANIVGNWLALPGQLFLTLIQMIVIPLVFASVIRGLSASENLEQLRKIGIRVVIYFVITTAIAITIGMAVALLIKPGAYIDSTLIQNTLGSGAVVPQGTLIQPGWDELPKKLVTILPSNPLTSMVEGQMLQVVLFAIIIGVALVLMAPDQAKPLLDLMASLQEVCMTVVRWAMWLAPYAVFGLLAQLTTKIGLNSLIGMAIYVATVLLGLFILMLCYLLLLFLFAKQPPLAFLKATREVLLLAFSTSSSAAVMPLSIKTVEEKLHVRPSISQFVIPLGATINMNGTALYQGVAAIFLAQVFGIDLSTGAMLLIIVTAVGASIGSPATPGVGIVILALVLDSAGIPTAGIALIMGVDRILDMSRTAINVCGDLTACILMDRWVAKSDRVESAEVEAVT
ncbi:MAG: dicarboxylate/amino acid:cation symporter [Gammaproteobacteria bacterium]|nr:dicarboxylate/amino acid:cation symporter [Gammaproteobacteria bacterium]